MKREKPITPNHLLRQARERRALSQEQVAEAIGSSSFSVHRWERGFAFPSPFYRQKLCAFFVSTPQELGFVTQKEPQLAQGALAMQHTSDSPPFLTTAMPLHAGHARMLVGRDTLLEESKRRIVSASGQSLFALCGLPGVGKTALAIALASDPAIQQHFPDGVVWVGLGRHPSPFALLQGWGRALGWTEQELAKWQDIASLGKALRAAIGQRRLFFLLDDIWRAEDVLALKIGGPQCLYLVTTRHPTLVHQIASDNTLLVPELDEEQSLWLLKHLAPETYTLFPHQVQRLARQVGGLPLALQLLGHFLHQQELSKQPRRVQTALQRLQQAQTRLTLSEPVAPVDAPLYLAPGTPLSLQAAIRISTEELSQSAYTLLKALALLPPKPNTFSEEAAYALSGCTTVEQFVEQLDILVDAGLLETDGQGRYLLHQTIADFAQLGEQRPLPLTQLAEYFATYIQMNADRFTGMAEEEANICVAFESVLQHSVSTPVLKSLIPFARYLKTTGSLKRARLYLKQAQVQARHREAWREEASAWYELGWVAYAQGDYRQGEAEAQRNMTLAEQVADIKLVISGYHLLGTLAYHQGDFARALHLLDEGIAVSRQHGFSLHIPHLRTLGQIYLKQGEIMQAEACYQEGFLLAKQEGAQHDSERFVQALGVLAAQKGELLQAQQYFMEALTFARNRGSKEEICLMLANLGGSSSDMGEHAQAQVYLREAAEIARACGFQERLCGVLASACDIALREDNLSEAQSCLDEGLVLARQIDSPEKICLMLLHAGRTALKHQAFDAAEISFTEGTALARRLQHKLLCRFLSQWGILMFLQGHYQEAREFYQEALTLAERMEFTEVQAEVLFNLAHLALLQDEREMASQYSQQSLALFEHMHFYRAFEVKQWMIHLPLDK